MRKCFISGLRAMSKLSDIQIQRQIIRSVSSNSTPRHQSTAPNSTQHQLTTPRQQSTAPHPSVSPSPDPFHLVNSDLASMFGEIQEELSTSLVMDCELDKMAKYYFDGGGKCVRPVIAMCLGHAFNRHLGVNDINVVNNQWKVAIISEMIHTASLVHDDILDHAETRRGKESVNLKWGNKRSAMAGDYILAVGSRILARIGNQEVLIVLSQVLADLVEGELMQLQTKEDEDERFQHYLTKSFNKTASLMALSCKANAVLSGANSTEIDHAFDYGRNIGIAFQLVDDLLDFDDDLHLGLATAPVLFATSKFPELNEMIARRFSAEGDVETTFNCVYRSGGLEQTRELASKHTAQAVEALGGLRESSYRGALVGLCDTVLNRMK